MLQQQESPVSVDDHGFARLFELPAIAAFALRLHTNLMKDSSASPWCFRSDFAHTAIFERPYSTVNLSFRAGVPQPQPELLARAKYRP
jgi:hypothetical protein